jgi:hypothetical protein
MERSVGSEPEETKQKKKNDDQLLDLLGAFEDVEDLRVAWGTQTSVGANVPMTCAFINHR